MWDLWNTNSSLNRSWITRRSHFAHKYSYGVRRGIRDMQSDVMKSDFYINLPEICSNQGKSALWLMQRRLYTPVYVCVCVCIGQRGVGVFQSAFTEPWHPKQTVTDITDFWWPVRMNRFPQRRSHHLTPASFCDPAFSFTWRGTRRSK